MAVTIRALVPNYKRETTFYIAKNAEPYIWDTADFTDDLDAAVNLVVRQLCGRVTKDYMYAFAEANDLDSPYNLQAGHVTRLKIPACLYTKVYDEGREVVIRPGQTAGAIYKLLTGAGGSTKAMEEFFRKSPNLTSINAIGVGQVLRANYMTLPTTLIPVQEKSVQQFQEDLEQIFSKKRNASQGAEGQQVDSLEGRIVSPVETTPGGISEANQTNCTPSDIDDNVFERTAKAYRHSFGRRKIREINKIATTAKVAIVDNGFFGADPDLEDNFSGSPFKSTYFNWNEKSKIEVNVGGIQPLNYFYRRNGLTVNKVSGHGTHVTGLVLGGPQFSAYLPSLRKEGDDPWVKLTIVNIGKGQNRLLKGTHETLVQLFSNPRDWIVNLSIAYTSDVAEVAFSSLIENQSNLFIVAAGNAKTDGISTLDIYPAVLGGPLTPNVITVAATDGSGGLADFSNRGDKAVDLAAPGCKITSWIGNSETQTAALSGTSQATPLVTFAASLLRSLDRDASATKIKNRLIAAGDLVPRSFMGDRLAYGVRLNIWKSLLWFEDIVRVNGEQSGTYLGKVLHVRDLWCQGQKYTKLDRLWAFKKKGNEGLVFSARKDKQLQSVCRFDGAASGKLVFQITHRIDDAGIHLIESPQESTFEFANVEDLVLGLK